VFWYIGLPATAQTPSAAVMGHVVDETGAAVSAARVEITSVETDETRTLSTATDGTFSALQLPIGTYRIIISKDGFRTLVQSNLELQLDQTAELEFGMRPGDPGQRVEITTDEAAITLEDKSMADTAEEEEIEDTPLDGRDFQDIAFQAAGVLRKAAGGAGSNYSMNGARSDNTNFLLDGFNNRNVKGGVQQIRVPIDAMQEMRVEVNTYSAEYARFGGGVMNVVLRGGTNQIHGTMFEFLRNDALDARNFFSADKNALKRNQFGANATGPVVIPHLYHGQSRTFFLFTWESYRQVRDATQLSRVPTALERQGNFSQTVDTNGKVIPLKDPLASGNCNQLGQGGCFPGNVIPLSRFHPVALQVRDFYPLPNNPGSVNNYITSKSDADNWDSFLGKVDHRISAGESLAARFARRLAHTTNPFAGSPYPMFGDQVRNPELLAAVSLTSLIGSSLTNDARFGLVRTVNNTTSFNSDTNWVQQFGIPGVASDRQFWGFPRFTVRDLGAIGDPAGNPAIFVINSWQIQDSLGWVRRKHTLRFGGELLRGNYVQDANNNLRGTYNFLGRWTGVPFADFLLGDLNQSTRQVGSYRNYLTNNTISMFAQDDWRVSSSFTVNLGVRYEMYFPVNDKYGHWINFVPELGKQVVASTQTLPNYASIVQSAGMTNYVTTAQEAGLPSALVYPNLHDIGPRVGFAWRPFGLTHTVVRSGYGIFYSALNLTQVRGDLGAAFPFLNKQTYSRNANDVTKLTMTNPFPDSIKAATDVSNSFGYQMHAPAGYLQAWNFTVEQELNSNTILEVAYNGSKGTHLGRRFDINQPFRSTAFNGPPFPRPYAGWNTINYYQFGSNSSFQAAIFTLRRRLSGGGILRLNYTLAKSIDDASQLNGSGDGGYGGAQDSRHLFLERGRSDWDARHSFSGNINYPLPLLRNHRWLGGWRISSTARIYSGQPFTPQTSNVQLDQGEANRPDRIAFGTLPNPTPDRWFDITAFPVVPTGSYRFGNSGRNILNGPGMIQINCGLMKQLPLDEHRAFQLRVEAFDVPNHPNFDLPNVNVNAVNGGTITSASDGRLVQVALKFIF
jgi:hypothetical protein